MGPMLIRYYPDTLLSCYPFNSHMRDISMFTTAEQQEWIRAGKPREWEVGNMDEARYQRLMDDIREHGMQNPLIIEHGRERGTRGHRHLRVGVGHNRACCLKALGIKRGPALFVVPRRLAELLPPDKFVELEIKPGLLEMIRSIWGEVVRDGEVLGTPDAWLDSNTLSTVVRSTMDDPNKLQHRRPSNEVT